jgi:GrpB-like predicted nucleotidyltransferase (UPF0157 family)
VIGLRQGIVQLSPYDDSWPAEFTKEAELLRGVFGNDIEIEHVGSTAIPGLIAKPLIDIQVGIKHLADARGFIPRLVALGYHYMPERDKPDEVFLPKGPVELRTHYLHIVEIGSVRWKHTLLFRDYLRAHNDVRHEYARLKQELAQLYGDYRPAYTEAKTVFVASVIDKASREQAYS